MGEAKSVIVVGCGRVGSELAVRLVQDGHRVTVIDKAEASFRRLPDGLHCERIEGYGFDDDILRRAGIGNTYALAAVTSGDNSNILTARIARERFDVANVVARIYDPRRALIYQRLGIQTVATVTWTTQQVIERIFPDRSGVNWTDPSGELVLIERTLPVDAAGKALSLLNNGNISQVVGVIRASGSRLMDDNLIGQEGDRVLMLTHRSPLAQQETESEAKQ